MRGGRFEEVQCLRAVAAVAAVFSHAIARAETNFAKEWSASSFANIPNIERIGHFGVDLFFAISGFVMIYAHHGDFQKPGATKRFLYRRLTRIVPIYWMLTVFAVGLLLLAPHFFTHRQAVDWRWILGSLMFIPVESSDGIRLPVLGLGWTLNYEVYFYALLALTLWMPRRRACISLATFFAASIVAGMIVQPASPWGQQITSWLLAEFVMGMGVGLLFLQHEHLLRAASRAALAVGILGLLLSNLLPVGEDYFLRFVCCGIPSALILLGALGSDWSGIPGFRIAGVLGRASYSIYLVQVFALPGGAILLRRLQLANVLPIEGLILAMTLISVTASLAFWALVERPLTNLLQGKADLATTNADVGIPSAATAKAA